MDGIDGKWVREIYSDTLPSKRYKPLTFLGSYEHYYKRLSTNWNKATKAKYNQMINSTILPAIKDHNKKYIWQYVRQDYDDAMQTIISNGYKVSGERKEYSESYLATIRRILSTVVRYASQAMDFSNVLWGTVYDLPESVDSDVEKFLIKKSLTPLQEQLLLSALLRDIHAHGSAVGLLLMMALGVRDAEACGLNYGDIIPLETHADCMFARICKTTKIKSNKLQAGGKSINTGRYVYVPDVVYKYLQKRKSLIASRIQPDTANTEYNLDKLPICCNGRIDDDMDVLDVRCCADQLSAAAHDYFERAQISPRILSFIDAELMQASMSATIKEKSATAYLLRRNFATHIHILGLTLAEMQYTMGHEISDVYETRSEYVDDDRLYAIAQKLRQRPLFNSISQQDNNTIVIPAQKEANVRIVTKEPFARIELLFDQQAINPDIDITVLCMEHPQASVSREVDVLSVYKNQPGYQIRQTVFGNDTPDSEE